jgi:hypothetical protein
MPGQRGAGRYRTPGSWIPRFTGIGVVVLLAGGGLILYATSGGPQVAPRHPGHLSHQAALSAKVHTEQTVGLIDVGPYDDGDSATNDWDDHPLNLLRTSSGLEFTSISRSEIVNGGIPLWTADQMADGTYIFIYSPNGRCLASASGGRTLGLEHCDLGRAQRWRVEQAGSAGGLPFDQFANVAARRCLSASKAAGGAPSLQACGPAHDKAQEFGLWWGA